MNLVIVESPAKAKTINFAHHPFSAIYLSHSFVNVTNKTYFRLLKHNKDIVSGLYLKKPKGHTLNDIPYEFACLKESDKGLFTTEVNGELIEVFGNGMGWMLVKKGVFEKTPFPWFGPIIEGLDFNGEDVAFQMRTKDSGFSSYVDTSITVGHEKDVILK